MSNWVQKRISTCICCLKDENLLKKNGTRRKNERSGQEEEEGKMSLEKIQRMALHGIEIKIQKEYTSMEAKAKAWHVI